METSPPRPVTLHSFLPALGWLPKVQVSSNRANGLEFLSLERFLLSLSPFGGLCILPLPHCMAVESPHPGE